MKNIYRLVLMTVFLVASNASMASLIFPQPKNNIIDVNLRPASTSAGPDDAAYSIADGIFGVTVQIRSDINKNQGNTAVGVGTALKTE